MRARDVGPFGDTQYVRIVTPATADTTFAVKHQLPAGRYRDVRYLPVRQGFAVPWPSPLTALTLYQAQDKPPEPGVLYLRATVASATVDLLLFLPRDADD
jgi:hypothetical protein